mgnify:CR=1 FL=1
MLFRSVLTAYQLFGPPGGLPAAIPADQMATQVKSGRMMDAFSKQSVGTDLVTVNVPGAHAMSSDAAGDLALFRAPVSLDRLGSGNSIPFHGLPLAAADPKNGDIVWMAGPVEGDTAPLHAAHIVEVKPGFLFYAFDGTVNLLATSGSPLLNSKGEVVGIHLGGGVSDGQTIGAAGPVSTVRKNLAAALTVGLPMASEFIGPTQTASSPSITAGMSQMNTVGLPGPMIVPPTWGTTPVTIGQT